MLGAALGLVGGCREDAEALAAPASAAKAKKPASKPSASPPAPRERIAVQPLGAGLGDDKLRLAVTALKAFYDYPVEVLAPAALPRWAYYAPRKRYRAEKLLRFLNGRVPEGAVRILGLTASDISTTKGKHADWGILGLADIGGSACVVSSFRTRRGAKRPRQPAERFAKTAVHEIGHTLGLRHCARDTCLMRDGGGSVLNTDCEYDLCVDCRSLLARAGWALADSSVPVPWPEPRASR
jgi:archaemetzincin